MEIQTTIRELPQRIKSLNVSPETSILVIIDELMNRKKMDTKTNKKPYLPFLDEDIWDDRNGPVDISENTDYYIYDLDNPHGE
ncbi:hypothetical protein QUF70_06390 [Desulfobacterales bacterium HSG17]|nr:hypothetical protein [Desulfobacterales bacterium HSG17]